MRIFGQKINLKRMVKQVARSPVAGIIPGGSYLQTASSLMGPSRAARAKSPSRMTPMQQFGGMPTTISYGGTGPIISEGPGPVGPGGVLAMGSLPTVGGAFGTMARRVNWGRIWQAVKVLGVGAVATALNMEVGQLAAELLKHPKKTRRRGITARQLNSARRVNRVVCGWAKQLQTTSPARRRTCK